MDNCWGKDSNGECYTSSSQTGYQGFLNFHDPSGSSTVSSTCDTFQGLSASLPVVSQLQKSTLVGTSAYSVVPVSSSNLSYSTAVPTATFNSASGLLNSSSNNQLTGFQATYSGHSTAMNPVQQHDFLGVTPFVYTQPGQVSDNQYSSTPVPSSSVTTRGPGRQLPSTNICSTSTPFTPLQPNHLPIHTPKACSIQDILMSFSIPLPASSTTVACTPSSLPLSNSILSSQAQIQTSSFLNQSSVNSQLQVSLSSAPFNSCSTMPVTPSSTVISVSQPNFSGVQPFVYPQPGQVSDQYLSTSTSTKITTRLPVRQQPGTASFCSTSTPFTPLQQSHPPIYSPNAFLSQGDLISYSSPQPVSNKTIMCTLSPTLNPTLSPSVCSSTPKIHITPFLNNFPVNNQVQAVSSASFNSYSTVYSSGGGTGDLGQGSHLSTQIGMPTLRAQTSSNADLSRKDNLSEDKGDSNNCSKKLSSVCSQDVVYLGEVQKPELNDKSEEVIFVRKNYNRSGLVCLTPNKKIRRRKSSTYTKRVSSDDSKTEVNITISRTKSSDETALPTSEWSYQTKSGLETFDPKTTSLLELLFHTGSDSNIILTLPGKADKYAVNMDTLKMTNNRSGEELLLYRKPIELLQDVADDLIPR